MNSKQSASSSSGMTLRLSEKRGHVSLGWLESYHTFSFGDYYDPKHMGFRTLRVINDDRVAPTQGFGMHPHKDMEILTYVIEGSLQHKDSVGHEAAIDSGDVQKITAGTGILHSEFNSSRSKEVHLLQIWIVPAKKGLKPSYQQFTLSLPDDKNPLTLVASPKGGKNIIAINQDTKVYRGVLKKGKDHLYRLETGRGVWVQMVKGKIGIGGQSLKEGDGASIENLNEIYFIAQENSEFLLFDFK